MPKKKGVKDVDADYKSKSDLEGSSASRLVSYEFVSDSKVGSTQIMGVQSNEITGHLLDGTGFNLNNDDDDDISQNTHQQRYNLKQSDLLPQLKPASNGTRQISVNTLDALIAGKYKHIIDHFVIIDCRYGYEYNGGHIKGALNIQSPKVLRKLFEANLKHNKQRVAFIFHCEYSQKRGPRAAMFLRNLDRAYNRNNYPSLCFPHCYVLSGGYKNYVHTTLEDPQQLMSYISMFDGLFSAEMGAGMKLDKSLWGTTNTNAPRKVRRNLMLLSYDDLDTDDNNDHEDDIDMSYWRAPNKKSSIFDFDRLISQRPDKNKRCKATIYATAMQVALDKDADSEAKMMAITLVQFASRFVDARVPPVSS